MTFDFDFVLWTELDQNHPIASRPVRCARAQDKRTRGEILGAVELRRWPSATVIAHGELVLPGVHLVNPLRALFERAAFEHQTLFENGRSLLPSPSSPAWRPHSSCRRWRAIPIKPSCSASSVARRAVRRIPPCSTSISAIEALMLSPLQSHPASPRPGQAIDVLTIASSTVAGHYAEGRYLPPRSSRHRSSFSWIGRSEKENSTASPLALCTIRAQLGTTK